MTRSLHVVAYHYVRDLENTPFPRINGMRSGDFRKQVVALQSRFEMATLETALAFLGGVYEPTRDLCLLTFDDGLKEHGGDVTAFLAERGVQGQFFVITGCLEERRVAPVHMSHFLMASLGFDRYRKLFIEALAQMHPGSASEDAVDPILATSTYRFDTPEVASFKYLVNFRLGWETRDTVLRALFVEHLSPEAPFAESLYIGWDEARAMQASGMVLGGHSHAHKPLGLLNSDELHADLTSCRDLLTTRLGALEGRPFSYPYGNDEAFNADVVATVQRLGFSCAYSTKTGANQAGSDAFALRRVDCNDVGTIGGQ